MRGPGFPLWRFACLSLAFDDSAAAAEFVQGADPDRDATFRPQPFGDLLVRPAASPQFGDECEVWFKAARVGRLVHLDFDLGSRSRGWLIVHTNV